MTPNKQVSPAIRILRGERDASARATHLEAANEKYLLTTNERKQMSTTTNFKRIALVAVAALGLGVLSSVPSQAVGNLVVTVGGTATTAAGQSDSTTAATITLSGTIEDAKDTITVSFVGNGTLGDSVTASGVAGAARLIYLDTATAARSQVGTTAIAYTAATKLDSVTAGSTYYVNSASIGNVGAKFGIQLDSATTQIAGTYSFTVFVKQFTSGVTQPVTTSYPVSIVSAAPASASATASSVTSTALLYNGGTWASTTTDSTVAVAGKSSASPSAAIKVDLLNAASGQSSVRDSITVTIDKGNASIGTANPGTAAQGKSLVPYSYVGSTVYVHVYPDGSSGTATITIATKNAGTFTKTVTFIGSTTGSIVATLNKSVIALGAETANSSAAVKAAEYDALSNNFGTTTDLYAYSSDTSVISNYGTACSVTYTTSAAGVYCPLTGVKAGTATITVRDASTVALSTAVSNGVSVRVSTGVATSFTLTTDKASYAPGEKGYLIVTVKDAAGLVMPNDTFTLASGGITNTVNLGSSSDVLTGTSIVTQRSSTPSSTDPIKAYTFYAPVTAGSFTFSAKGGSAFGAASQATATTVTATVADSASAALAAVSALAVTVASLKTLITTLTNLVLKIQKKVKA